jgi:uncharacterized membrane protein
MDKIKNILWCFFEAIFVVFSIMVVFGFATDNLFNFYHLLGRLGVTIVQARLMAVILGIVAFITLLQIRHCRIKSTERNKEFVEEVKNIIEDKPKEG